MSAVGAVCLAVYLLSIAGVGLAAMAAGWGMARSMLALFLAIAGVGAALIVAVRMIEVAA